MTELIISDPTAVRLLQETAQRMNLSVDEAVKEILSERQALEAAGPDETLAPPGTLQRLAQEIEKRGYYSGSSDLSERSREILNTEFADYLTKRRDAND